MAEVAEDPSLAEKLVKLRSTLEPYVKVLGPMHDKAVYNSYLEALKKAQRDISLPMLATTPQIASVPTLQECAKKGVRVRILLGAPRLVANLRGETMTSFSKDVIQGWKKHCEGIKNMEIRISDSEEDMQIATCTIIDKRLLRFDIYDPKRQRSLQGVMVEANSTNGNDLNLVRITQKYFDNAWKRAKPINRLRKIKWYTKKFWEWAVSIFFTALTFFSFVIIEDKSVSSTLGAISGSIAASFFISAFAATKSSLRRDSQ